MRPTSQCAYFATNWNQISDFLAFRFAVGEGFLNMRGGMGPTIMQLKIFLCLCLAYLPSRSCQSDDVSPTPWPEQFHAEIFMNMKGSLYMVDIWYDYPNGRNFNIIQTQLSYKLWDVEWNNGTSYYFDLEAKTCYSLSFPVGLPKPDWLVDQSHYVDVQILDGFTCHVFEKLDFVTYYEDVHTHRPVAWYFHTTDQFMHVMTFEVGAVLPDMVWQAPSYCFSTEDVGGPAPFSLRIPKDVPSNVVSSVMPSSVRRLGQVESS